MDWTTQILPRVKFWSDSPGVGWGLGSTNLDPLLIPQQFTTTDQATVEAKLKYLYEHSSNIQTLIDSIVANNDYIRVGLDTLSDGEAHGSRAGYDNYILLDLNRLADPDLYFMNEHGTLVHFDVNVVIAHELDHAYHDSMDPSATTGSQNPTFDYKGSAVRFENLVATDLGLTSETRSAYAATTRSAAADGLVVGKQYTNGDMIDDTVFDDQNVNHFIDLSGRADNSRDLIFGFNGNDEILSGGGRDYLYGGQGDDTLDGGSDQDLLEGEAGADLLKGGDANDDLRGGAGADTLSGGDGADTLSGGADADRLLGGAGNDVIYAETDDELADGGADIDTVDLSAATQALTSATSLANFEILVGTAFADQIAMGGSGGATLHGMAGNDTIQAGSGADVLYGGQGDDVFLGSMGADTLNGGDPATGVGTADGVDTADYSGLATTKITFDGTGSAPTLTVSGLTGVDSLISIEKVIGSYLTDDIKILGNIPTGTNLTIWGARGDVGTHLFDWTTVGQGLRLDVDANGVGVVKAKDGSGGQITLENFQLKVAGSTFDDIIHAAFEGVKNFFGHAGNDEIVVSGGSALINGGDGDDTLAGGAGDDQLTAGAGANALAGGAGADKFYIDKSPAGTINHINGVDAGDEIIWNGYKLNGGLFTLIDGEIPVQQTSTYTQFQFEDFGYLGSHGEIYRVDFAGGNINIDTPDGGHIVVSGYSTGGAGLSFANRVPTGTHERDWLWSPIVNNGSVDYANLPGRAEALAQAGKLHAPDVQGSDHNDSMEGTNTDDSIDSGDGNDEVNAHDGNDLIYLNRGDDTVHGGAGDDVMYGGGGSDAYNVASTDGDDEINESAASSDLDVLNLTDVASTTATVAMSGSDLVVSNTSGGFHVKVDGFALGGGAGVEQIKFSDGVTWDRQAILDHAGVVGSSGPDTLVGTSGPDNLKGEGGNDLLRGGLGSDRYVYNLGDGSDRIEENQGVGDTDVLAFGSGLNSTTAVVTRSGGEDATISFNGVTGSVLIKTGFSAGTYGVEQISFGDGVTWTKTELQNAYLQQAQTAGNDTITGFDGSTTFTVNALAGNDRLVEYAQPSDVDRLVFGSGLNASTLVITRSAAALNDVTLSFTSSSGSLTIADQFLDPYGNSIEQIQFGDGTVWTQSALKDAYLQKAQTAGNDTIYGFNGSNTVHVDAFAGDDHLVEAANAGDTDRLVLGVGYNVADLVATVSTSNSNDLKLVFTGHAGALTLDGQLSNAAGSGVEEVQFGDGTIWTKAQLAGAVGGGGPPAGAISGTTGNDTLVGTSGADTFYGNAGADILSGGGGADTYLYNSGDGADQVSEGYGGVDIDRIVLGAEISPSNLLVSRIGGSNDVTLGFSGSSGLILLKDEFVDPANGYGIEQVQFANGTVWTRTDLQNTYIAQVQTAGSDVIYGFSGSTTFNVASLSGADQLVEGYGYGATDRLVFGSGLNSANVLVTRNANSLDVTLGFAGQSGTLTLRDEFQEPGNGYGIEQVQFADGVTWTPADFRTVYLAQAQTVGNDVIYGFSGATTITVNALAGADRIYESYDPTSVDRLVFGSGLNASNLTLTRTSVDSADIALGFVGSNGSVTLKDEFQSGNYGYGVEEVRFGDGTVWTAADLKANYLAKAQTAGSDTIYGFSGPNTFNVSAMAGNDVIVTNGSASELDRLVFSSGLNAPSLHLTRSPTDANDLVLTFDGQVSSITLDDQLVSNDTHGVDEIQFADGTVWTRSQILTAFNTGTATITGTENADTLTGTASNDVLIGLGGGDAYVFSTMSGNDKVLEGATTGQDFVVFGTGLTNLNVHVTRSLGDLNDAIVTFDGVSGSVTLDQQFYDSNAGFGVEQIEFGNGIIWHNVNLQAAYVRDAQTAGNDDIYGFAPATIYYVDALAGNDRIVEGYGAGYTDEIFFGTGLNSTNVTIERSSGDTDDVVLTFTGSGGSLNLHDEFYDFTFGNAYGVEKIHFADSVVWDRSNLRDAYIAQHVTAGSDTMLGFDDANTYTYATMGGDDWLIERSSNAADTVVFGAGLNTSNLMITRSTVDIDDVVLSFTGVSGSLTLDEEFYDSGSGYGVEHVQFGNGQTLDVADLKALYLTQAQTSGNDTIHGFEGDTTFTVNALTGNDVLVERTVIGDDTLVFGAGLTATNLVIARSATDLDDVVLSFVGSNGSLTLDEQFYGAGSYRYGVETIAFANGQTFTVESLKSAYLSRGQTTGDDTIYGFDGDTTITVNALAGNDVLVEAIGLSQTDTLVFGAGLNATDLIITRSTTDLEDITLSFTGSGGSVMLDEQFADAYYGMGFERVQFGDGTIWTGQQLRDAYLVQVATNGADTVTAFEGPDHLYGGGGADSLSGGSGADTLSGGSGADTISGGGGADLFVYGTLGEAPVGLMSDIIVDFVAGTDRIDLNGLDANAGTPGDQAFSFIGTAAFSNVAGQLRVDTSTAGVRLVLGDVDGDGAADFQVQLSGNLVLASADFVL